MTDYVVDSNVWVMVDKAIAEVESKAELDCIEHCQIWLREFVNSENKLIVDVDYKIIGEYRNQMRKYARQGGLANTWLNQLETPPRDVRLIEVEIQFDSNGDALVPAHLMFTDKSDRKFIAVALTQTPVPPIVNAVDCDWEENKQILIDSAIPVMELCPRRIEELILRKSGK